MQVEDFDGKIKIIRKVIVINTNFNYQKLQFLEIKILFIYIRNSLKLKMLKRVKRLIYNVNDSEKKNLMVAVYSVSKSLFLFKMVFKH